MFADLLQSTRASLLDRLSSPLIGSFVVSWAIWNWKFLVVLFSDASVTATFQLAQTHSFPDITTTLTFGLLLPAASAAAYILLYPYPYRWVLDYTLRQQRLAAQVRQRIEDETPLTVEESRRLRVELVNMDRKHRDAIAELNEEITRLNAALEEATSQERKTLVSRDKIIKPELIAAPLTANELAVLRVLDSKGGKASHDAVVTSVDGPRLEVEVAIGELEKKDLIERLVVFAGGSSTLSFTHKGRKAYLEATKRADA